MHCLLDVHTPAAVDAVDVVAEGAGRCVVALSGVEGAGGEDTQRLVARIATGTFNNGAARCGGSKAGRQRAGNELRHIRCRNTQAADLGGRVIGITRHIGLRQRLCCQQSVGVADAADHHLGCGRNLHAGQSQGVVTAGSIKRQRAGCRGGHGSSVIVLAGASPDVLDVGADRCIPVGRGSNAILRHGKGQIGARTTDEVVHQLGLYAGAVGVEDHRCAILEEAEGEDGLCTGVQCHALQIPGHLACACWQVAFHRCDGRCVGVVVAGSRIRVDVVGVWRQHCNVVDGGN